MPLSEHRHTRTRIATSQSKKTSASRIICTFSLALNHGYFLAELLAVGDAEVKHYHAEVFESDTQKWKSVHDYPFTGKDFENQPD